MRGKNYLLFLALLIMLTSCSTGRGRQEVYPVVHYKKTYAVASWYGPKFNGRPTASGEIFDMFADTCAHKVYVFGTRLRVTNVSNDKTAVCVVNDRGPFIRGRDIDLSYGVAKKIGLVGPGTGRVLIETVGRDRSYVKSVKIKIVDRSGPFAIQVGAFTVRANAVRLKKSLDLEYNNAYIRRLDTGKGTYFRVRIGNFVGIDSAISVAEKLSREGYRTLVVRAGIEL